MILSFTVSGLEKAEKAKFAVFRDSRGTFSATIFPRSDTHADKVQERLDEEPGSVFLGAGFVHREGGGWRAEWKSETCEERFGLDRPKDEKVAAAVLREFQERLNASTTPSP